MSTKETEKLNSQILAEIENATHDEVRQRIADLLQPVPRSRLETLYLNARYDNVFYKQSHEERKRCHRDWWLKANFFE